MAGEETILSIILSSSELARIDLSSIQLFQTKPTVVDQYGGHFNHPLICPNNLILGSEGHENLQIRWVDDSKPKGSPELLGCVSPVMALGVPIVLKSKGVIEAERSMIEQHRDGNRRKKAVSMDETGFKGFEAEKPKARDDSALDRPGFANGLKRGNRPPAMPMFSRNRGEEKAGENVACIDLKSSPASKFLVQVMPWELQPSPITPYTPAAVPFKWEEVPGKPKPHETLTLPVLQLPPPPTRTEINRATVGPGDRDDDRDTKSLGSSHLDHKLSRTVGSKASALIGTWRRNRATNYTKNASASSVSCDRSGGHSGEFLMGAEDFCANPKRNENSQSLNARIAAAMDVQLYDDNKSARGPGLGPLHMIPPPFPSSSPDRNGKGLEKKIRRRRKWVTVKLRRPSRFLRAFFRAIWKAVSCRNSRHRRRGNSKLSYQSLSRPDALCDIQAD